MAKTCEIMYVGEFWTVEVGKGNKGSYTTKYDFITYSAAFNYYHGLNIHSGYKKRLVYHVHHIICANDEHNVVARYIS